MTDTEANTEQALDALRKDLRLIRSDVSILAERADQRTRVDEQHITKTNNRLHALEGEIESLNKALSNTICDHLDPLRERVGALKDETQRESAWITSFFQDHFDPLHSRSDKLTVRVDKLEDEAGKNTNRLANQIADHHDPLRSRVDALESETRWQHHALNEQSGRLLSIMTELNMIAQPAVDEVSDDTPEDEAQPPMWANRVDELLSNADVSAADAGEPAANYMQRLRTAVTEDLGIQTSDPEYANAVRWVHDNLEI